MCQPLISIIIPCFDDAAYIEQSVRSALSQTHSNKEIIVVDDGSNKETKAVLKRLAPKITLLITQVNKGASTARNVGIEVAKGEYLLVLDSDDYFEAEFCEKAIKIFQKHPETKIVTSYARWFWNNEDYQIFKPSGGDLDDFLIKNCSLGSMFLKRDWCKAGGYDEKMIQGFEDWEFYIRLLKLGGQAYVIPEILFHYRKRIQSKTIIANKNKYDLLEYIYQKHADLYKKNFEFFVKHMLSRLRQEEKEKIKNAKRIEFRLGETILRPFRFTKSLIKKHVC